MSAHFPSGMASSTRRDARVRRIHVRNGGDKTLCNKPKSDGDIVITVYGTIGHRAPSNLCKVCQQIYLR